MPKTDTKAKVEAPARKAWRSDPLPPFSPRTPRQPFQPDDTYPTCSEPTANNKGCEAFRTCQLGGIRSAMRGPVQVVMEDHRTTPVGQGRRQAIWCFHIFQKFLGDAKAQRHKAGYSIAEDRVYERTVKGVTKYERLPPPEDQGPYYRSTASEVPQEVVTGRQAFIDQLNAEASFGGD